MNDLRKPGSTLHTLTWKYRTRCCRVCTSPRPPARRRGSSQGTPTSDPRRVRVRDPSVGTASRAGRPGLPGPGSQSRSLRPRDGESPQSHQVRSRSGQLGRRFPVPWSSFHLAACLERHVSNSLLRGSRARTPVAACSSRTNTRSETHTGNGRPGGRPLLGPGLGPWLFVTG